MTAAVLPAGLALDLKRPRKRPEETLLEVVAREQRSLIAVEDLPFP